MLDFVISGSSGRVEPDATAVHLTNIEKFLVVKCKDSDYNARADKDMLTGRN